MTSNLPPKTYNKDHEFKNNLIYGVDDNQPWTNGNYAVLKNSKSNVKLYIDASIDPEIKQWHFSKILYTNLFLGNNFFEVVKVNTDNYTNYYNGHVFTVNSILEFTGKNRLLTYKNNGVIRTISKYNGTQKNGLPPDYQFVYRNYEFDGNRVRFVVRRFSDYFGVASIASFQISSPKSQGSIFDTLTLEVTVIDSIGEGVDSAPVYFSIIDGQEQNIIPTDGVYSLTDNQGKATAGIQLLREGYTKIQIQVDDLISTYEISCVTEETEIYIRGVSFQTQYFINNPDIFFDHLNTLFGSITGFSWTELGVTQASISDSVGQFSEQLLVFFKGGRYNDQSYMSLETIEALRSELVARLNTDTDIRYKDVELRTYRRFVNE